MAAASLGCQTAPGSLERRSPSRRCGEWSGWWARRDRQNCICGRCPQKAPSVSRSFRSLLCWACVLLLQLTDKLQFSLEIDVVWQLQVLNEAGGLDTVRVR